MIVELIIQGAGLGNEDFRTDLHFTDYIKGGKGDKGDAFTFEDFTPEQIEVLQQPATEAAEESRKVSNEISDVEEKRATAEQNRVTAEGTRKDNEAKRVTTERTRVESEAGRIDKEKERVSAETSRASAEQNRTLAEDSRRQEHSVALKESGAATTKADSAAEHATEVAAGMDGRMTAAEAEMFQLRTVEMPLKADITPATGATSALRALFVARGAVWNEKTGFYELNGLTDISEREIIEIYDWSSNWLINRLPNLALLTYNFALCPCRTIFPYRKQNSSQFLCGSTVSLAGMFFFSSLNVIPIHAVDRLINDDIGSVYVYSLDYTFYNCSLLDRVIGAINCQSLTVFNNAFINCRKLRELKLLKLTCSVSLQNSPLLERMYILYMINNAANTTPITLTLHTDAAARLTAEDIALASLKNITIA